MHEESTVSLKVYLMEGQKNIEVRRFEVDHGVITNYDYMRERLQMAIPTLRGKVYKLLWQDADGDEITISSDEELMIALSEFKSNICKFIVRMPVDEEEKEAYVSFSMPSFQDLFTNTKREGACPMFSDVQGDVTCSSCKRPITGFRYKCLECVQYCQCGDCEIKKMHPDHVVIRLQKDPSLSSLIPKFMRIVKSHIIRASAKYGGANYYFRDQCCKPKESYCSDKEKEKEKEKEKCGSHHRRKFRKHGHHDRENKHSSHANNEENPTMQTDCPFSDQIFSNIGNVVEAFLGMYKDTLKNSTEQPEANPGPSTSTVNKEKIITFDLDGPPMPSAPEDSKMEEDNMEASNDPKQIEKDAKLKVAEELLSEMGFTNENQWLTRLLEHFDGDIAKTLDHLTLGK